MFSFAARRVSDYFYAYVTLTTSLIPSRARAFFQVQQSSFQAVEGWVNGGFQVKALSWKKVEVLEVRGRFVRVIEAIVLNNYFIHFLFELCETC